MGRWLARAGGAALKSDLGIESVRPSSPENKRTREQELEGNEELERGDAPEKGPDAS